MECANEDCDFFDESMTDNCAKGEPPNVEGCMPTYDLVGHLHRQRDFSIKTFGPGKRTKGVIDHIRKELKEIEAAPYDLTEWVDLILLSLDGAWRAGFSPEAIVNGLQTKLYINENREWPDWRTLSEDKAIEHVRDESPAQAGASAWTACADSLPDTDTTVMTFAPDSDEPVWPAYHDGKGWVDLNGSTVYDAVTHWMLFPDPPEGFPAPSSLARALGKGVEG